MNRTFKLAALAASLALLAACGGGGDGPAPTPPTPKPRIGAEGVWQGTLSDGRHFSTLVLEDGSFATLYGPLVKGVFLLEGLLQGPSTAQGGAFNSTDARDFQPFSAPVQATVNATYTPGDKIQGAVTERGAITGFAGDSGDKDTSRYDYNAPATLAAIEGVWTLTTLDGAPVAATVKDGALQATSNGCNLSGTILPRASGRNVYDVALTFGPAPCQLAGQQMRGNAIVGKPTSNQQQITVMTTNADRSAAVTAFGTR